jgi:hypothetical protein
MQAGSRYDPIFMVYFKISNLIFRFIKLSQETKMNKKQDIEGTLLDTLAYCVVNCMHSL